LQAPLLIAAAEVVPWTAHHLASWSAQAGRPLQPVLAGVNNDWLGGNKKWM